MSYEPVIGLEVHAQLKTKSKLFCGCSAAFEASENVYTCPVCTGMPGSLPVLNKTAVDFAIKMALATHCRVNEYSVFSRKNYFYPDLPKGYQISQYDKPLAEKGTVEIETDGKRKKIGLIRIHMEEDAGKNVHRENASFVNLNRAGVPLIEIVSQPDLRTPQEASAYLKELRKILRYLDISEANMEEGNLRCDVNVSLRLRGGQQLGTRTEIKNINSFRFVEKAIAYEINRQRTLLEEGQKVVQETRLWDAQNGRTRAMRSKEEAHDYRYFPEPDLRPLVIDPAWQAEIGKGLPELPSDRKRRFIGDYQLSGYDAELLVQEKVLADYFEEAVRISQQPKLVSNWILSELLREFHMEDVLSCPVTAAHLGELVQLIDQGTISGKIAKTVFEEMARSGERPAQIVKKKGLVQIIDERALEPMIEEILKKNSEAVERYHAGNQKLFGFFVGQVMKATQGKANPALVHQLLQKKLKKS